MAGRIQAIKTMLEKSPDDVFLHYSLGMEYSAARRFDEAAAEFKRCVELDENYLAAFVEAGKSLRSAGRLAEAREILAAALELAGLQGETHTQDYVRQQLESLPKPPSAN
ncbi:MAG: tetratricopeptide repeat protein [Planctomycetota bacterium]|jgi:tetratricopeptide (TPR) repeat protein